MTETPAERRHRERMALNDVLARTEERTAAQLLQAAGTTTRYAWCFDHGIRHAFDPEAPWCTACWVWLDGNTEDAATADKASRFGEARFLHELPDPQRLAIIRDGAKHREEGR